MTVEDERKNETEAPPPDPDPWGQAGQDADIDDDEAADEQHPAPARRDGPARLLGFVALLAAAAAIGGLVLLQWPGSPYGDAAGLTELRRQVASLGETVADQDTQTWAALNGLTARLERLQTDNAELAAAQTGLAEKLGFLETRTAEISALAATMAEQVSRGGDPAVFAAELAEIRAGLAQINDARLTEGAATAARLAGLSRDLAALTKAVSDGGAVSGNRPAGQAAVLLAVGQLKDAAARSTPFQGAWRTLLVLAPESKKYTAIADAAALGAPTLVDLQQAFQDAVGAAIVADKVGAGDGWMDSALKRLGSLVELRRTGDLPGDAAESVIARAEQRLLEGRLDAALSELAALQGAAQAAMSDWMAGAARRARLDQALTVLQAALLAELAKGVGAP